MEFTARELHDLVISCERQLGIVEPWCEPQAIRRSASRAPHPASRIPHPATITQACLKIVAALLLFLEPLRFALEALAVFPTITYRGAAAAIELVVHGSIGVLAAAAAFALWNAAPDARKLATTAIIASFLRTLQSQYWSSLPNNTAPGDEMVVVATALIVATIALAIIRRGRDR